MVIRFFVLLLTSLTIIFRIEPSLAFTSVKFKSHVKANYQRNGLSRSSSAALRDSRDDNVVFARFVKSIVITATSLQILSAGYARADPPPSENSVQATAAVSVIDTTSAIQDSQVISLKFPELTIKIPDMSLTLPEVPFKLSDMPAKLSELPSLLNVDLDALNSKSDELLNNLPRLPISLPEGSKLLTTTVRPDNKLPFDTKKIQWWKQTGLNLEKVTDEVKVNLQSFPAEFSNVVERVRSLTFNWQIVTGLLGVFIFADSLQSSRQLNRIIDEQNVKMADQEAVINSSRSMNSEIVDILKTESVKLIDDVDILIEQLDQKTLHINSLNETLQNLSLSINGSDTTSKQMLSQYSSQLVSQENLIRSLKSQIIEIPKKIAREVAAEYEAQLTVSEKKASDLKRDLSLLQRAAKSVPSVAGTGTTSLPQAASVRSTFPPISASFPTSIFTPAGAVEALAAEQLAQKSIKLNAENTEMKMKLVSIESEKKAEKSKNAELVQKIARLETSLKDAEARLTANMGAEDLRYQELNARLLNMEKTINAFMAENEELKRKLVAAEDKATELAAKEAERAAAESSRELSSQSAPMHDDDSDDKSLLLRALTRENDDLKQRLLNSDERLIDMQQDNLKKLETAKIMTKQLNARLTEIGVQQENKEGKSKSTASLLIDSRSNYVLHYQLPPPPTLPPPSVLLQVKELEEAKENTQRLLTESLDTLASLRAGGEGMDREMQSGEEEAAKSAAKIRAKKITVKSDSIDPSDDASAAIKNLKVYQVSPAALTLARMTCCLSTTPVA